MAVPNSTPRRPTLRGLRATKLRQKELRRLARDGEIDPPMTAQLSRRLDDFNTEETMESDEKIETARIRRSDRKRRATETRSWLGTADWSDAAMEIDSVEETDRAIIDARVRLHREMKLTRRRIWTVQFAGGDAIAGFSDDTDWGDTDGTTVTHHTVTQDAESASA